MVINERYPRIVYDDVVTRKCDNCKHFTLNAMQMNRINLGTCDLCKDVKIYVDAQCPRFETK